MSGSRHFPKVVLHRANTKESIESALKTEGVTGIEIDAQITKDGEVILYHDILFNFRPVKDQNYSYIKGIFTDLLTLREAFQCIDSKDKKLDVHLELKNKDRKLVEKALDLVIQHKMNHRVFIHSFMEQNLHSLYEISNNETSTKSAQLVLRSSEFDENDFKGTLHLKEVENVYAHKFPANIDYLSLSKDFFRGRNYLQCKYDVEKIKSAHKKGLFVWTVNDLDATNIDPNDFDYIITDKPRKILDQISAEKVKYPEPLRSAL